MLHCSKSIKASATATQIHTMPKLLFQLGTTYELSKKELYSVYPDLTFTELSNHFVSAEVEKDFKAQDAMNILGGTVKIFKEVKQLIKSSQNELSREILHHLITTTPNKERITYGISEIGRDHLPVFPGMSLKKMIQSEGHSARFYKGPRPGLSSAVLSHNKVREVLILNVQDYTVLAEILSVQDIDQWSHRDRGKPYANKKSGMLPPKVARMMVNLALGEKAQKSQANKLTLLDPFCGTGTVLQEAYLSGCNVIGADISQEAIEGTKQNLKWLIEQHDNKQSISAKKSDVAKLELPQQSVDFIVTEPFLGKPRPNIIQLPNIFTGLEKMYLGAFKQWRSFLKNKSTVVVVFPMVEIEKKGKIQHFNLEKLIDKLVLLGYTMSSEPVLYHRPKAIVKRNIYTFTYTVQ